MACRFQSLGNQKGGIKNGATRAPFLEERSVED
jgi:hypothetical protein